MAMGKVARMYKTLRQENENILKLKGLAGGSLPVGILQQGAFVPQTFFYNLPPRWGSPS